MVEDSIAFSSKASSPFSTKFAEKIPSEKVIKCGICNDHAPTHISESCGHVSCKTCWMQWITAQEQQGCAFCCMYCMEPIKELRRFPFEHTPQQIWEESDSGSNGQLAFEASFHKTESAVGEALTMSLEIKANVNRAMEETMESLMHMDGIVDQEDFDGIVPVLAVEVSSMQQQVVFLTELVWKKNSIVYALHKKYRDLSRQLLSFEEHVKSAPHYKDSSIGILDAAAGEKGSIFVQWKCIETGIASCFDGVSSVLEKISFIVQLFGMIPEGEETSSSPLDTETLARVCALMVRESRTRLRKINSSLKKVTATGERIVKLFSRVDVDSADGDESALFKKL